MYTCVQISPVLFARLRSEEVVIRKSARRHVLFMVVMEMLKYTCIPSFTSMQRMVASLISEEVVMGKRFMVVMETLKCTCVPSFTSTHCMVCKFER